MPIWPTCPYVTLYVDDLLIIGKNTSNIAELKSHLSKRFKMTDLGPIKHYLGIEVIRNKENYTLILN